MSDFSDVVAEDRRLVILRLLESQDGYTCNESILQTAIEPFGHTRSRDQVRADFEWLKGVDLITYDVVSGRVWVATLTQRGVDVATGRERCPGVKRPSPKARS